MTKNCQIIYHGDSKTESSDRILSKDDLRKLFPKDKFVNREIVWTRIHEGQGRQEKGVSHGRTHEHFNSKTKSIWLR